ncbi:hypothetical protein AK51_26980 [Serratia nematodiphila DZ0503SBS1]|nr:hypothetical protein AK51_26980 [Serratia nematodiphila DZ0503SBS1]
MTDSRTPSPSQAELLQRDGVLLIVDSVQPPPGLVPKGQTPVLKPKEQGLFIALCGSGEIYAFNGHVDLGTGVRTALGQIVAEELYLRMDQVQMVLGDTERAPNQAPPSPAPRCRSPPCRCATPPPKRAVGCCARRRSASMRRWNS